MTIEEIFEELTEQYLSRVYSLMQGDFVHNLSRFLYENLDILKDKNLDIEEEYNFIQEILANLYLRLSEERFFEFHTLVSDPTQNPPILPSLFSAENAIDLSASPFKGIAAFELLAKCAPYQLFRYAMDGEKQAENKPLKFYEKSYYTGTAEIETDPLFDLMLGLSIVSGAESVYCWEQREPGSIRGVLDAYAAVLPIAMNPYRNILVDDLHMIHVTTLKNVNTEETAPACREGFRSEVSEENNHIEDDEISKYSNTIFSIFGTTQATCSVRGLVELIDQQRTTQYCSFTSPNPEDSSIEKKTIKQFYQLYQKRFEIIGYCSLGQKRNLKEVIEDRLVTFNHKLYIAKLENNSEKMLLEIVKLVRDLEHIHPYRDGNCRSFCMVLLNTLLMQQNFLPTIMDDPNQFDGYAVEELVNLVKQGMEKTHQLCVFVQSKLSEEIRVAPDVMDFEVLPERRNKLSEHAVNLMNTLLYCSPQRKTNLKELVELNPGRVNSSFLSCPSRGVTIIKTKSGSVATIKKLYSSNYLKKETNEHEEIRERAKKEEEERQAREENARENEERIRRMDGPF